MVWWITRTRKQKKKSKKSRKKPTLKIPAPGPNQCHPNVGRDSYETFKYGCIPESIYQKAAKMLKLQQSGGSETKNTGQLVDRIAKHLGVDKINQRSLLNKLPLTPEEKQSLASKYLRPEMPLEWRKDPDMWLDSNNIRDVMKQYEDYDKQFKFLGPYPIDFASQDPESKEKKDCIIDEMCELNLKREELNGKTKIGIIYNLDPHYKNGSHWIANYIDLDKDECYYFDSYGMKPPKQVYKFMQWLTLQEPNMKLGWNGRRFQLSDSECGMYCMYFIDRMIAGESFLKFCRRAPPDSFMLDLRDWMFST